MLIQSYQQMVEELYCAPKEDYVLRDYGKFFRTNSTDWRRAQAEEEKDNFDD